MEFVVGGVGFDLAFFDGHKEEAVVEVEFVAEAFFFELHFFGVGKNGGFDDFKYNEWVAFVGKEDSVFFAGFLDSDK